MPRQLTHEEVIINQRQFPVRVLCDNITTPANVGMIFRICEGLGVEKIHLGGETTRPPHKRLQKASRSTENYIAYESNPDLLSCINSLKEEGYTIIAVELTDNSQDVRKFSFKSEEKVALVVGAEAEGVSQEVLDLTDHCVEIPLFGKNSSLNVATALSIALYEAVRQFD